MDRTSHNAAEGRPPDERRELFAALRRDPAVAQIIQAWRALTGGAAIRDPQRRTLIACSGGADSSALALALSAASEHVALGHIVHDLRPPAEALADRDAVAALAARLGIGFAQSAVEVRPGKGNLESKARHARYRELGRLCGEAPFLATAHQGDDQLETMLMRLVRGSGPKGLAGIRASRLLPGFGVRVVRPMLGVTRADSERICRIAGHAWREDATNRDTTRLRAAIRADIVPRLKELAPHAAERARTSGELLAQAAELVDGQAAALLAKANRTEGACAWDREALRGEKALVLGTALRLAAAQLTKDAGLDRLTWRLVRPVVEALADGSTEPRRFQWRGVVVEVTARGVVVRSA